MIWLADRLWDAGHRVYYSKGGLVPEWLRIPLGDMLMRLSSEVESL